MKLPRDHKGTRCNYLKMWWGNFSAAKYRESSFSHDVSY
jgi:hypothetical protein